MLERGCRVVVGMPELGVPGVVRQLVLDAWTSDPEVSGLGKRIPRS